MVSDLVSACMILLDLLDPVIFEWIRSLVRRKVVLAMLCSPPCSTFSRARHRPLAGPFMPRPLRDRDRPLNACQAELIESARLAKQVHAWLSGLCNCWEKKSVRWGRRAGLEHPEDLGPLVPSLFNCHKFRELHEYGRGDVVSFDQCMTGAHAQKPTSIWSNDVHLCFLPSRCTHKGGHRPAVGIHRQSFRTTALAAYSADLCSRLARSVAAARAGSDGSAHLCFPFHGRLWRPSFPGRAVPSESVEGEELREVRGSTQRFQM